MKDDLKIAVAEAEVERARDQLIGTINEVATYFEPDRLLDQAWKTAKTKGAEIADGAIDAVTSKPLLISGALAAIAAFLARGPIKDAAVKAYDAMTSSDEPKGKKPKGAAKAEPVAAKLIDEPAPRMSVTSRSPVRRTRKVEKPT